jgi:hypothetical protein
LNPGYIKGYVPGVRENGGQYTHAAIWAAMAFARLGDNRRAWELFTMINPVNHARSAERAAIYKVEPYVVAADVYAVPPHTGRGGWTWYTGSAAWMYRLIVESLLGLELEVDKLRFVPCLALRIGKGSRCTTAIGRRSTTSYAPAENGYFRKERCSMVTHPDARRKDVLEQIARRAMQKYGFLPDFSTDALRELEAVQQADRVAESPGIDLRHLLWVSIDNDDSLDLDQLTVAEVLTDTQVNRRAV